MINARIKNSVVSARLKTTPINARGFRASSSTTSGSGNTNLGSPIGLLLALTYATTSSGGGTTTSTSDFRPNIRIITN